MSFARNAATLMLMSFTFAACSGMPTSPSAISGGAQGSFGRANVLVSDSDRQAAEVDRSYDLAIIQISELAENRADLPSVKFLARQLLQDFKDAITQLVEISEDRRTTTTLSAAHQAVYDRLKVISGSEFDRAYIAEISTLLQTGITDYTAQSTSGTSTQLRAHAAGMASMLRTYLAMAQELGRRVRIGFRVS